MRLSVLVSLSTAVLVPLAAPVYGQQPDLVKPGAVVKRVADGFGFLEGPTADSQGNIYFTDIPNDRIHRLTPGRRVETFVEASGRANGLRVDQDGSLIVCEMGNRRVTRIDATGQVSVLAEELGGRRFNSPNDLWIDPDGGIYFSDPRYGPTDDKEMSGDHVYYIAPDRASVVRVADGLVRPNGLVGTPDGRLLYIADHGAGRTYVYRRGTGGTLSDRRLFVAHGSDGMTMDEMGNVYLTGQDVTIYDPDGESVGSIAVPETPANLSFGGQDGTTLFITARTSLYAVEMTVTGQ